MSAGAFLEGAEAQDDGRYQPIGGQIVATAPERMEHSHVTFQVAKALDAAISTAKLPCRVFVDGVDTSAMSSRLLSESSASGVIPSQLESACDSRADRVAVLVQNREGVSSCRVRAHESGPRKTAHS